MARHRDDSFKDGWESGDIPGTIESRSYVSAPNEVHEAIVNMIHDMIQEEISKISPRMATVMETATGGVLVQLDDEDEPRTIKMSRKTGNRYKAGDRVVIHKMAGGGEFIGGVISNKADGQVTGGRVGTPDLEAKAVGSDQIDNQAVQSRHIDNGAILVGHLAQAVLDYIQAQIPSVPNHPSGTTIGNNNRVLTEASVSGGLSGNGTGNRVATRAQVDTAQSTANAAQTAANTANNAIGNVNDSSSIQGKIANLRDSVSAFDSAALSIRRGLKAGFMTLGEADDRYQRL